MMPNGPIGENADHGIAANPAPSGKKVHCICLRMMSPGNPASSSHSTLVHSQQQTLHEPTTCFLVAQLLVQTYEVRCKWGWLAIFKAIWHKQYARWPASLSWVTSCLICLCLFWVRTLVLSCFSQLRRARTNQRARAVSASHQPKARRTLRMSRPQSLCQLLLTPVLLQPAMVVHTEPAHPPSPLHHQTSPPAMLTCFCTRGGTGSCRMNSLRP